MTLEVERSYEAVADLNLWFRVAENASLTLADVSILIPLRWQYFRDNWNNLEQSYKNASSSYSNPDLLNKQIAKMSNFINLQRKIPDTKNPFSDGDTLFKFFTIFDVTELNNIKLSNEEQTIVDNTITKMRNFTRNDFIDLRTRIEARRDSVADITGTTDDDYNEIKGRSPAPERISLSNTKLNEMMDLQNAITTINFVLANIFELETNVIDPFALARENANNPEIDVGDYTTGRLVRFNFGENLQDIAGREMGDRDRWLDIAIANGLKPPYIDEDGKKVPLLSNASGNQINLDQFDLNGDRLIDQLYARQIITLQSDTQPILEQRSILSIKEVDVSGEIIVELDGDLDLDKYKINENAHIRFYKSGTINSSFAILIPTSEPLVEKQNEEPFFLNSTESDKRLKVDLLVTETGDLSFTASNDIQLSNGINNAIQALKIKLSIEVGELRRHLDFGLANITGLKNNDTTSIKAILVESIEAAITADSRFDRVERLDINYFTEAVDGSPATGFDVKLDVRLAGTEQSVPITFAVST